MLESLKDIETSSPKDPMRVASLSAVSQLRKRFYKKASVHKGETAVNILLDGKAIKTPAGETLFVSNSHVGKLVADEWNQQKEHIDPQTMPVTRLINTSIDGVLQNVQAVKDDIVQFAGSDLLCYRADNPEGLVSKQNERWNPLVVWINGFLGAGFSVQTGIVHIAQPDETISAFSSQINSLEDPSLIAAAHSLTSITGSAIIALALIQNQINADDAWNAAHVDEDWQISQWGEDGEASLLRKSRRFEFNAAIELMSAISKG